MEIWRLSNTGVRNPLRIQNGLKAYAASDMVGHIRSRETEIALGNYLASQGVLNNAGDPDGTYGRKWRFAWNTLGFTYVQAKKTWDFSQSDLGGAADTITPLGKSLMKAESLPTIQDCFLRSMTIPLFTAGSGKPFSPLCWTLNILLHLEKLTGSPSINFSEFAVYVQTTDPSYDIDKIVNDILYLRKKKSESTAKKQFDATFYNEAKRTLGYELKSQNFKEYGDLNLRYLRITGLFQRKGRGIIIVPEKLSLARILVNEKYSEKSLLERFWLLYSIPPLPTDNYEGAKDALVDLTHVLKDRGIVYDISQHKLDTVTDVNDTRLRLQNLLDQKNELNYAVDQKDKWQEISDYMVLVSRRGGVMHCKDGSDIEVPKDEAAAYLEWVIWRSFLAMDNLMNPPYKVRSFNIDQDFFPVSTAGGGKSDLVAEYPDCVIVGEVTMSTGSRQEAMEGEPVRRHVADIMPLYSKPVYGLFIAIVIDMNTTETFRLGVWYQNNERLEVKILPLTLAQYNHIFRHMFEKAKVSPRVLVDLILKCNASRANVNAPEWQNYIDSSVQSCVV